MATTSVLEVKDYPEDYPSDAVAILDAMSMGKDLALVGSMSLRSQQYAGDYDGYEIVKMKGNVNTVLTELRKRFQSNIKKLRVMPNVYIGDIKAGVVDAWRVIPRTALIIDGKVQGYNATHSRSIVDKLLKDKIISEKEADDTYELLKDQPTVQELLVMKGKIKFHVVRWSVPEVLANKKKLRDGSIMTLEQAFHTPGISKLDVIGLVQNNRFTDFSVIYQFRCNGKILNPEPINMKQSLEESILAYMADGKYFKVLKRIFALSKLTKDTEVVEKLTPILNSDLGRIYHISGDIGTLISLLSSHKRVPLKIIRFEIDQFIQRLSNIYVLKDYLKKDDKIIGEVRRILKLPVSKMIPALEKLGDELDSILQKYSKPIVEKFH